VFAGRFAIEVPIRLRQTILDRPIGGNDLITCVVGPA
jgi:hypothetical protein